MWRAKYNQQVDYSVDSFSLPTFQQYQISDVFFNSSS